MKRTVEVAIVDKENRGTMMVTCNYEFEGKIHRLTSEDKYEIFERNAKDIPQEITIFLENKTSPKKYSFEVGPEATEYDDEIRRVVDGFWGHYPTALINGVGKSANSNFTVAILDVQDVNQRDLAEYNKWSLQRKCADVINNAAAEKLMNMASYFGVSVHASMLREEIIMLLAGWEFGLVCGKIKTEALLNQFIELWGSMEKNDSRDMIVNVRKAMNMGIIRQDTLNAAKGLYIQEIRVGGVFEDALDYLRRDPALYENSIVKQVAEREKSQVKEFSATMEIAANKSKIAEDGKVSTVVLQNKLNEIATYVDKKLLPDVDYTQMSVEELDAKIKEAKAKKKR